jgi:hypothetical protein
MKAKHTGWTHRLSLGWLSQLWVTSNRSRGAASVYFSQSALSARTAALRHLQIFSAAFQKGAFGAMHLSNAQLRSRSPHACVVCSAWATPKRWHKEAENADQLRKSAPTFYCCPMIAQYPLFV